MTPRKKPPTGSAGGGGGQNIQVFVRCRPLNGAEKAARSYSVVDTPNSREISVKEKQASSLTKTFQFDRVFGPKSKQMEVYRSVVEPLISQVLQGYNCTVFAYGQTGTGKTFTMEGGEGRDDPGTTWENDPTAGIVPRALAQLFDELRVQQEAEFSVRVSYLELYNEEIFDLLSATDDTTRLRLYEDSSKKGSVIIQNLAEVQVHNKREVYEILEKGSYKRKTAETLMNAHSSRSHTVFTVTVHLKESSVEGEEVLRTGKLNLVDLAGSENIGRSGASDKRAREAGNINQSLLTLGRVITCLVERSPHIPYRESKLTRLLQDSLGGRTKTSIIATVSPAGINLEETLSTLDYAHRAKNIQNKPEVNQKLSKKAVLKEYTEEIERLRKDLMASREKNGVFLAHENYQSLLSQIECQSQEITEKIGQIKAMKEEMEKHEELFAECSQKLQQTNSELESTSTRLKETEHTLNCTNVVLHKTATEREENKHLVDKHVETELRLSQQAKKLLAVSDEASADLKLLHEKLDRGRTVEQSNEEAKDQFLTTFNASIAEMLVRLNEFRARHADSCASLATNLTSQLSEGRAAMDSVGELVTELMEQQNTESEQASLRLVKYQQSEGEWRERHTKIAEKLTNRHSALLHDFGEVKMTPLVQEMADKLDEKAAAIKAMEKAVLEELESLVQTFTTYSDKFVVSTEGVMEQVKAYTLDNMERMASVQAENKAIRESEEQFKVMLDGLMNGYRQHRERIEKATTSMDNNAQQARNAGAQLSTAVQALCQASLSSRQQLSSDSAEQAANTAKTIADRRATCLALNETVAGQANQVSAHVTEYIAESRTLHDQFETDTEQSVAEVESMMGEFAVDYRLRLEKSTDTVAAFRNTTKNKLDEQKTSYSLNATATVESVQLIGALANENTADLMTRTSESEAAVQQFLCESLQRDIPTGRTPARTERTYPRFLAATSPHQRILDRYRQASESANVAARLPLDDDDDDSVISSSTAVSGKISRQNSTVATGGSGVRRNLSREPSVEMTIDKLSRSSASSVTSELGGSLAGDQENRDPAAVGGKTSTLGRSKSRGRREIPRPEIKTRKHLSSAN